VTRSLGLLAHLSLAQGNIPKTSAVMPLNITLVIDLTLSRLDSALSPEPDLKAT